MPWIPVGEISNWSIVDFAQKALQHFADSLFRQPTVGEGGGCIRVCVCVKKTRLLQDNDLLHTVFVFGGKKHKQSTGSPYRGAICTAPTMGRFLVRVSPQ